MYEYAPIQVALRVCSLMLLVAAAGCGGGGSGGGESEGGNTAAPGAVQGMASKGPLQGATVDRYAINSAGIKQGGSTANASTDAAGNFNFGSSSPDATLVETCGGSFVDESDPATPKRRVSLSSSPCQGLTGILPANAATVAITPITQALYEKALRETNPAAGDFELVYGNNRSNFQAAFGFDPVTLIPTDPTNPTGSTAQKQYAMVLGGFAQVINAAAVKLGMSAPSYDLIQALIKDLSDGRIDGEAKGNPVPVGIGGPNLPGDIDFNAEINRFRNNNAAAYAGVPLVVVNEDVAAQDESIPCVDPPEGLVGWWPGDGNADDIVNENHGTLQGSATFAPGMVGQAFDFNGIGAFVEVPDSTALSVTGSLTIDAWVKPRAYASSFDPLVSKWNDIGVNKRSYTLLLNADGQVSLYVSSDGTGDPGKIAAVHSGVALPLEQHTHVAGVFDADAGSLTLYFDGVPVAQVTAVPFNSILDNDQALMIGAGDAGGVARQFSNAVIDEVEIFNRALDPGEIQSIYNAGSAGKCKNILRPNVMLCGGSSRSPSVFYPPGTSFTLINSCTPDANAQAIFVTRGSGGSVNAPVFQDYVSNGGIVLTEYSISHLVWQAVFNETTVRGNGFGSCQDTLPSVVQFNPSDPFWLANTFQSVPLNQSGCGFSVGAYPGITALAGWDSTHAAVGYRALGQGRVWATDFDWQDNQNFPYSYTIQLMGYMMTHRRP